MEKSPPSVGRRSIATLMLQLAGKYGLTTASDAVLAAANLGLLLLLGSRFDGTAVAGYLLARRVIAILEPAMTMGMHLSLVRYLATSGSARRLVLLSLIPIAATGLLTGGTAASAPLQWSELLLGSADLSEHSLPTVINALGIAMTTVAIGVLRGRERVNTATAIQISAIAFIPLAVATSIGSVPRFLAISGLAQISLAALVIVLQLKPRPDLARVPAREMFGFGVRVMLRDFAMMVLFWLPPYAIAHSIAVKVSGSFSLTLSLAITLASPVAPLAMSIMPLMARAKDRGDQAKLRQLVFWLVLFAAGASIVLIAVAGLVYDLIVSIALADTEPLGKLASLTMIASAIPLAIIYALRHFIDVQWSPFRNVVIILGAIGLFLLSLQLMHYLGIGVRVRIILAYAVAVWGIAAAMLAHPLWLWMHRSVEAEPAAGYQLESTGDTP